MKQVQNLKKKASTLLLAAVLSATVFPQVTQEVRAAEDQLPAKEQFATAEELRTFNTNDTDGEKNPAKVYFGKESQEWWIAGSQNNNLTLFAASSLGEDRFESISRGENPYSAEWNCDYTSTGGSNPETVYRNHYGASSLRNKLKGLENTYFTNEEQKWMNKTTIYTNDKKNQSVYSTTDKLYLAYGDSLKTYVTVGENSSESNSLNNGLRIDKDYWVDCDFWLRAPSTSKNVFVARQKTIINNANVTTRDIMMAPAFELDLSDVLFGSKAPSVTQGGQLDTKEAMTLRYQKDIGNAIINGSKESVAVTNITNDNTYLVVQNSQGAWAKKVSNNDFVAVSDIEPSLTSFENCKAWLETTDDTERMTYAVLAAEGQKTPAPDFTITQTATSITVNVTNYDEKYGEVQYKLNDGQWQTSNTFSDLKANTAYTVSVQYKGEAVYLPSDEAKQEVTTYKHENEWTEELSIKGWTSGQYDEKENAPTAKAKFGEVAFSYSKDKDGKYTSAVPKEAGTWYVKAIVAETDDYTGLETVKQFTVKEKKIPEEPQKPTDGNDTHSAVQTGDDANILSWGIVAVLAILAGAIIISAKRKVKKS